MTDSIDDKNPEPGADQPAQPSAYTRLPHRRTDWYSARKVQEGVKLQAEQGTQAAAAFLKSNSIVPDITIRALLHPDRRRSS